MFLPFGPCRRQSTKRHPPHFPSHTKEGKVSHSFLAHILRKIEKNNHVSENLRSMYPSVHITTISLSVFSLVQKMVYIDVHQKKENTQEGGSLGITWKRWAVSDRYVRQIYTPATMCLSIDITIKSGWLKNNVQKHFEKEEKTQRDIKYKSTYSKEIWE